MKKAMGYVRVSTDDQVKYGNGLETQEEMIRQFCDDNGIELVEIYREEGMTGKSKTESRKAWIQVEDFMMNEANDCKTLIVYNTDRLARLQWVKGKILYEFQEKGWEILSVTEKEVMSQDPTMVLMNQIMGAFAEYEGSKIAARMKDGRIRKAAAGGHAIGRVPYGYDSVTVDGKKKLVINEVEAEVVRKIYAMHQQGYSLMKIANAMNDEGIKPKNWTEEKPSKWYDSTIRKILTNDKYTGQMVLTEHGEVIASSTNEDLKLL